MSNIQVCNDLRHCSSTARMLCPPRAWEPSWDAVDTGSQSQQEAVWYPAAGGGPGGMKGASLPKNECLRWGLADL